jgi:hypothetical protein
VRLARALKANEKDWLRLAGHTNLEDKKLQKILSSSGGLQFPGEMDPLDFFSQLLDKVTEEPLLMCVCYPSVPGTTHRLDVRKLLVKALENGLSLALVCPFPNSSDPIERTAKPSLLRYYREVYDHVLLLARDLSGNLKPARKQHLAVFVPRQNKGSVWWTMPAMGISRVRQTLISPLGRGEDDENLRLVAWVELSQDRKDRMIEVYPGSDPARSRLDVVRCWKDYFNEIILSCDSREGWAQKQRKPLREWRSIPFGVNPSR